MADATRHPDWEPWVSLLRARVTDAPPGPTPARAAVVAAVAHQAAAHGGWDPAALAPRLAAIGSAPDVPPAPAGLPGPDLLGAVHEALLDPGARRAAGAHYTPPALASGLVGWGLSGWGERRAWRVVDLAVGGGAFLLAAARHQRAAGLPVEAILEGLHGVDRDPTAVAVAEAALVAWAWSEGWRGTSPGPRLVVGDGTDPAPFGAAGPRPGEVDLVLGNPPFRGQLDRATARDRDEATRLRAAWGPALGGYVDDAAVFLLVASAWPRPGGRVVLVQPESVLGARDAAGVRADVGRRADLVGLWVAGEAAFAAAVDVCAVVLQVREADAAPAAGAVARADGVDVRPGRPQPAPPGPAWAPLLARTRGVPVVALDPGPGTVGDLATATAGFRQHFYALAPHLREQPDEGPGTGQLPPVLTTGLVDPVTLHWGRRPARIAGATWAQPVVDLEAVAADDAAVGRWVRTRLQPKVVVASQTRVVEAAVDAEGRYVPGVPLVSVEPRDPDADVDLVLWRVVAALSAPPTTAWALTRVAGTARHRDALRLSAGLVLRVPLPVDDAAWDRAAARLRAGEPLAEVGVDLTVAYGLDPDHPVTAWWRARLPGPRA